MRYLLDTNIIAEPTKPQPNPTVANRIAQYYSEVAIASVSWHELWFGTERLPISKRRQNLEHYLNELVDVNMPILPYTTEAARWFATERSRLVSRGLTPSYPDGQIAAIAATNNLILVTRNTSDFIHFDGLQLENWFE
jgi:tRNA(fMet)-specific endonuclease VapC